jgi:sensor histidine kinase YesM
MLVISLAPLVLYAAVAAKRISENALRTEITSGEALFVQRIDALSQNIGRLKNTAIDIVADKTMRLLFDAISGDKAIADRSLFQRIQISRNVDSMDRLLNAHFAAHKDIITGISVTASGLTAPTLRVGAVYNNSEAIRAALSGAGMPTLYMEESDKDKGLFMSVSFTGFSLRELRGICLIRLNITRLFEPILFEQPVKGGQYYVLDSSGSLIFRSAQAVPYEDDAAFLAQALSRPLNDDIPVQTSVAQTATVLIDDVRYIVLQMPIPAHPEWIVCCVQPYARFTAVMLEMVKIVAPFALLSVLIAALAALVAAQFAYRPIRYMEKTIGAMRGDNPLELSGEGQPREMALLFSSFNRLIGDVRAAHQRIFEESARALAAERVALRAQVSPHFLYNTLNVVKCLAAQHRTDEIQTAADSLASLLRASIGDARETVPLSEELAYVDAYIELQRLRLDLQFIFEKEIQPEALSMHVPRLCLQPLVENALIHAFPDVSRVDNRIWIRAAVEESCLHILIEDNGCGGDAVDYARLNETFHPGAQVFSNKIGLTNSYARANRLFGKSVQFEIRGGPCGTQVSISLQTAAD